MDSRSNLKTSTRDEEDAGEVGNEIGIGKGKDTTEDDSILYDQPWRRVEEDPNNRNSITVGAEKVEGSRYRSPESSPILQNMDESVHRMLHQYETHENEDIEDLNGYSFRPSYPEEGEDMGHSDIESEDNHPILNAMSSPSPALNQLNARPRSSLFLFNQSNSVNDPNEISNNKDKDMKGMDMMTLFPFATNKLKTTTSQARPAQMPKELGESQEEEEDGNEKTEIEPLFSSPIVDSFLGFGTNLADQSRLQKQKGKRKDSEWDTSNSKVRHPFFESQLWNKSVGFGSIPSSSSSPSHSPSKLHSCNGTELNPVSDIEKRGAFRSSKSSSLLLSSHLRTNKDVFWAGCYLFNLLLFFFIGLLNLLLSSRSIMDELLSPTTSYSSYFRTLWMNLPLYFTFICISLLFGYIWIGLLVRFAGLLIWTMIGFIPFSSTCLFIWSTFTLILFYSSASNSSFSYPYASSEFLGLVSICSLLTTVAFLFVLQKLKGRIRLTINITRMACTILLENKSLFWASFLLFLSYALFVMAWILFFLHLLLIGDFITENGGQGKGTAHLIWSLYPRSYILQGYFVVLLLWTTALIGNIQKYMIGGVVGHWYFNKLAGDNSNTEGGRRGREKDLASQPHVSKDQDEKEMGILSGLPPSSASKILFSGQSLSYSPDSASPSVTLSSLKLALTCSLGSNCLAAIVLYTTRSLRLVFSGYRQLVSYFTSSSSSSVLLRTSFSFLSMVFRYVERLIDHLTYFSIYHMALTGESFITSGRIVCRLTRRNLLSSLSCDVFTQFLFFFSTLTLSSLIGFTFYLLDSSLRMVVRDPASSPSLTGSTFAWQNAGLLGWVTFCLVHFIGSLLSDTMDAAFLCYILDVDQDKEGKPLIHAPFDQLFQHRTSFVTDGRRSQNNPF